MVVWNLYRHRHRDGSSKDWAVTTHPDCSISSRWGKTASRLPGFSTRNGVRQFDIEKQKQAKGYLFVAEVDIDNDGNVTFPKRQGQNPGDQPSESDENRQAEAEHSRSLVTTLYWHIDCKADPDTCTNLGSEVRRMLGAVQACDDGVIQAEQDWDGWQQLLDLMLNAEPFTQSGQIQQAHGVMPWLLLMALKFKGFAGVEIGIATEHSRELSADLKAEPEVLAFFGTDLDSIRPVAERLGLLKPKLNLAQAMADQDDSWF
ncbi:MAG: hypothetical protein WC856_25510 [Methylococcaceae bacterium]|jgi:hypothetical protein